MNIVQSYSDLLHPMWVFDGAQASVLEMFDINRDGRLSEADFSWSFSAKDMFHDVLVQSFVVTQAFKYPKTQVEGLRRGLTLFGQIQDVKSKLNGVHDTVMPYKDWKELKEAVDEMAFQLNNIHTEMATVVHLMSGIPRDNTALFDPGRSLGRKTPLMAEHLPQLSVNYCALRNDMTLDMFMRRLATNYNYLARNLLRLPQVQCEGNGCLLETKHLDTAALIAPMQVTVGRNVATEIPQAGESLSLGPTRHIGGGCFTGIMYFMAVGANGSPAKPTLFENYDPASHSVSSYNECDETPFMVAQNPESYLVHRDMLSVLLTIKIKREDGEWAHLEVTPEHPLLVDMGGKMVWQDAGDVKPGDMLRDGFGKKSHRVMDVSRQEGRFDLYNFHFEGKDNHPTFLVSSDGVTWVVAHNK